jgi:hypothetical protein
LVVRLKLVEGVKRPRNDNGPVRGSCNVRQRRVNEMAKKEPNCEV